MDLLESLDSSLPRDKVVLVGNPGVGKTTIFQRFKTGKYLRKEELSHHDREGQEFYKVWTVGDREVTMTLFDTAGVERYTQTIPPTYYRKARVVLLVYSVDNSDSFNAISSNWVDIPSSAEDTHLTVIVGNKCDLNEDEEDEQFVPRRRAQTLASNLDIDPSLVFEISALTGKGFQELFDRVAVMMQPEPPSTTADSNLEADTSTKQQARCGC